jgi:hypothetical protein
VRELVYIAQKIPPKLEQKSWTFKLRIEMPPIHGRRIIETFCSCPDCQHWVNYIFEPITLGISENLSCYHHSTGASNIKQHGALMVSFDESARFGVILEITDDRYAGADILIPEKTQTLKDAVEQFYKMRTESIPTVRLDRAIKQVPGGYSASLRLRPTSKQEYVVDISAVRQEQPELLDGLF